MTKEQESKMNDYYLELKEKGLLTTLSEANIFKLSYMQAFSLQGVSQQRELLIDFAIDFDGGNTRTSRKVYEQEVDYYLKSINCG